MESEETQNVFDRPGIDAIEVPTEPSKDAVLDQNLMSVFTGTTEEVKTWLNEHPEIKSPDYTVRMGSAFRRVDIWEYQNMWT